MPFFTFYKPLESPPPLPDKTAFERKAKNNKDNPGLQPEIHSGIVQKRVEPLPFLRTPRLFLVPLVSTLPQTSSEDELKTMAAAVEWANAFAPSATNSLNPTSTDLDNSNCLRWAMLLSSQATFIGLVELDLSDPELSADAAATLRLNIVQTWCGNGFSTEAAKAALQHVFSSPNTPIDTVSSVFGDSFPQKESAECVLERLGFTVAEHVSPSMSRDGTAVDGWTMWEISRAGFHELWS